MGKAREKLRRQKRKAQRREARREFSRQSAIRRATGENVVDLRGEPLTAESIPEAFARLEAKPAGESYPGERVDQKMGEIVLDSLARLGATPGEVNAQLGRGARLGKEG